MSTSETHNRANLRMARADSFAALHEVISFVDGRRPITDSLSTCFGCPMECDGPAASVVDWAWRFADLGVQGLTICDTTGMAHPAQVQRLIELLAQRVSTVPLTLHFHNTRGMGLANVLAAAQSGIERFDGSLGGLGGCPYAPGASGNICSEDTVNMLSLMGFETGIDTAKLLTVARTLPHIVGHDVPGQLIKAGLVTDCHPAPLQG
jgi:hydroxymethylglutaryl-CoA lyase